MIRASDSKELCYAGDKLRSDLTLAGRNLSIMRSSTETVMAPWLIHEMAPRIASTLNYFLLHLTGWHKPSAALVAWCQSCRETPYMCM